MDAARHRLAAIAAWARRPFAVLRDPVLRHNSRWIVRSALIGLVSGLGAVAFDLALRVPQRFLLERLAGFVPPESGLEGGPGYGPIRTWLLPVALVAGGLLTGLLVYGFAPEAEGHGTDAVLDAFHQRGGRIRRRVPIVKAIASAITIGSGGSAGREGPIAQIGAGFGSFLSDLLRLGVQERRVMMMAGVAGGIGSIFRAPLGAALFAAEILYSNPEFEAAVLIPALIASITGFTVFSVYHGWGLLFDVAPIDYHEPKELPLYLLLGVLCALAGAVYPKVFYGVRDRIFRPLRLPPYLKPALGALVVGLIGVVFPASLGMGYGYIQNAIRGGYGPWFLLTLAAIKIVTTSFTISSGGSGGVFGPAIVIGGALGGAFGQAAASLLPGLAPPPVACIMVGMGGFFAGVAKVPFASVVMVTEMTGSYGLLVPALLVAAIAYLLLPRSVRLYENQVPGRSDSPAHASPAAPEATAPPGRPGAP